MDSRALIRLPHYTHYTEVRQTTGRLQELHDLHALDGRAGFVFAPFMPSKQEPILLIRPDSMEQHEVSMPKHLPAQRRVLDEETDKAQYMADFNSFHKPLKQDLFRKIVLARCSEQTTDETPLPDELFLHACRLFPHLCVALVSTPVSGTWLIATPEVFLESMGSQWHTMALAGTMEATTDEPCWSMKNQEEQRCVATYIRECLKPFSTRITEEAPHTSQAGHLLHLRSDFLFTLKNPSHLGALIAELHPTPAVCGMPKEETRRFILRHEHAPRRYYSGFMGLLAPEADTHLYVSLRCMQIDGNHYRLYAGGGLMKDSTPMQEWEETRAKLETMQRCITL